MVIVIETVQDNGDVVGVVTDTDNTNRKLTYTVTAEAVEQGKQYDLDILYELRDASIKDLKKCMLYTTIPDISIGCIGQ